MGSFTPPPTTALAPGDRLDRYELLCILAQGGMGTVWLARMSGKLGFERLVALKTILPTYSNDRQFCDMFLDEAKIAARSPGGRPCWPCARRDRASAATRRR